VLARFSARARGVLILLQKTNEFNQSLPQATTQFETSVLLHFQRIDLCSGRSIQNKGYDDLIHVLAIGHWLWTRCYRLSDPVRQFSVTLISDIYCTHFTQGVVHLQLQLSLSSHFNISTDAGLFLNVSKFLAAGEISYIKREREKERAS
jgi:hypothetical protein